MSSAASVRKALLVTAQVALTLGLIYYTCRNLDFEVVLADLKSITLTCILTCLALAIVQIALLAERWRAVINSMELNPAWNALLQGVLIERLFAQILPAAIGGDAARATYLIRQKCDATVTITSIIYDRISGILGLILLAGLCALLFKEFRLPAALAVTPIALLLAMLVGMIVTARVPRSWIEIVFGTISGLRLQALAVTGHVLIRDARYSGRSLILSALVQALSCLMMMALAMDLAPHVSIVKIGLSTPVLFLAMTLPLTIAGWGVREQTALFVFGFAGASANDAIAISMAYGLLQLVVALLCGAVFLGRSLTESAGSGLGKAQ